MQAPLSFSWAGRDSDAAPLLLDASLAPSCSRPAAGLLRGRRGAVNLRYVAGSVEFLPGSAGRVCPSPVPVCPRPREGYSLDPPLAHVDALAAATSVFRAARAVCRSSVWLLRRAAQAEREVSAARRANVLSLQVGTLGILERMAVRWWVPSSVSALRSASSRRVRRRGAEEAGRAEAEEEEDPELEALSSEADPSSPEAEAARRRAVGRMCGLLLHKAQALERNLDVRGAVQCLEEALVLAPADASLLCLASKQWSDLSFSPDVASDSERRLVGERAVALADRAVAAAPGLAAARVVSCVARGRLAQVARGSSAKVRLASEAQAAAQAALALDPRSDLALHVLARWHYEMAKVPGALRRAASLMGGRLVEGSLELALARYRRAAEIAPDNLVHHVEAARVLRDLQRREEAREALERALACEVRDVNGWHLAVDARGMLAEMEGREFEAPSPPHPATPRLEHEHSLAGVRVGREQGGEGGAGGETGGVLLGRLSSSAAAPPASSPASSSTSQFCGRA